MTIHSFTLSGLGQSPFRVIAPPKENSGCLTKRLETFFCEHCGTMLKNRHFVKSSDGKVSVVGVDCLKKTGDAGLIAGHKRMVRENAAALREAVRVADRLEREALERQVLDGKTKAEIMNDCAELIKAEVSLLIDEVKATFAAQILEQSNFGTAMIQAAIYRDAFTPRMIEVMTDIIAKHTSGARKNTAAYKAALPAAESHVNHFVGLSARRGENIASITAQHNALLARVSAA